jgi:hypothetical protein
MANDRYGGIAYTTRRTEYDARFDGGGSRRP